MGANFKTFKCKSKTFITDWQNNSVFLSIVSESKNSWHPPPSERWTRLYMLRPFCIWQLLLKAAVYSKKRLITALSPYIHQLLLIISLIRLNLHYKHSHQSLEIDFLPLFGKTLFSDMLPSLLLINSKSRRQFTLLLNKYIICWHPLELPHRGNSKWCQQIMI